MASFDFSHYTFFRLLRSANKGPTGCHSLALVPHTRFAKSRTPVNSASLSTNRERVAKSKFAFEMGDPKHLGAILKAVRQVDGVFDAYRLTS